MTNDEIGRGEVCAVEAGGRICVITSVLTTGGSDNLLLAIWSRMRKRGYRVDLYSMLPKTPYGSSADRFTAAGITVHQPAGWSRIPLIALGVLLFSPLLAWIPFRCNFQWEPMVSSAKEVYRRIDREVVGPFFGAFLTRRIRLAHRGHPFDLISGYHDATCPVLFSLKRRLGIPVCYTEISSPRWRRAAAPGRARTGPLDALDRVFVPSAIIGRELEDCEGLTKGYTVVPFFVDLPEWVYRPPAGPARTLGCIARLSLEKNQDRLIRLFGELVKLVPDARLILVGTGPQEREYQALASGLGLSGSVEFIPRFQDLREIMERIDLFILLSDAEGMPLSVIEALYFGKPVIATPAGSIPDMITAGENGYIFSREAVSGATPAIVRLMRDEASFRRMSLNSRESYFRNYDPGRLFPLLCRLYGELMGIS